MVQLFCRIVIWFSWERVLFREGRPAQRRPTHSGLRPMARGSRLSPAR